MDYKWIFVQAQVNRIWACLGILFFKFYASEKKHTIYNQKQFHLLKRLATVMLNRFSSEFMGHSFQNLI
jgi:hypothetical protein